MKTDAVQFVVRSSVEDDPFGGPESQYSRELQQFLGILLAHGGQLMRPRLSMDNAHVQAVVEFGVPVSEGALEILGAALAAWIRGRVGRQIELNGAHFKNKADSAADTRGLIEQFATFQKDFIGKDRHD
jgi:hypothetical protein